MSTVTAVVVYVIRNVFSRLQNTESDMSSRSAAGKLFQTVVPSESTRRHGSHSNNSTAK